MSLPTYITSTSQMKAYRLLRQHVYAVLTEYDLTPSYWSMLGIITEARDGIRQVDIARTMHVKAPLVTSMAKQLQGRDLIHSVQNQFDSRAKLLAMTPDGRKFVRKVENDLHKELDKLLVGLTEQDLVSYHKVLTTIIANDEALKQE